MIKPEKIAADYWLANHSAEKMKEEVSRSFEGSQMSKHNQALSTAAQTIITYAHKRINQEVLEPVLESSRQYWLDNRDVLEPIARQEMEEDFARRAEERARMREFQWLDLQENLKEVDELREGPSDEEVWLPYDDVSDVVVDVLNVDSVEFYLIQGFMSAYAKDMPPELMDELMLRINANPQLIGIYDRWIELGSPQLYLYGRDDNNRVSNLNFTLPGEVYDDRRPIFKTDAAVC
jgi:hypothetical protein